jgi:hypothetical protein
MPAVRPADGTLLASSTPPKTPESRIWPLDRGPSGLKTLVTGDSVSDFDYPVWQARHGIGYASIKGKGAQRLIQEFTMLATE